jgi:hypothetical protein
MMRNKKETASGLVCVYIVALLVPVRLDFGIVA